MVEKLNIIHYRRLKDIKFTFAPGVNVICGKNGTCKTSLLYLISNSYRKPTTKDNEWNDNPISSVSKFNSLVNVKVEKLVKGDKKYNDPAVGTKGELYGVKYFDEEKELAFRKHNTKIGNRFSLKPSYRKGSGDYLPWLPTVYLSLSRLFPFSEFQDDNAIKIIAGKHLPEEYLEMRNRIYEEIAYIEIVNNRTQKVGSVKHRSDFETTDKSIDSNTISAGEDNLLIILNALVSLKFYYDSLTEDYRSSRTILSILLIDELDATLHPFVQEKILDKLVKFSEEYKIQIFFTTHSLFLIEKVIKKKVNTVYIDKNLSNLNVLNNPNIYDIKRTLGNDGSKKNIIVFTEDDESRIFLEEILKFFAEKDKRFEKIKDYLHIVKASFGSDNLINLFTDSEISEKILQAICILDGDKNTEKNKQNNIMSLPGGKSPEKIIAEYLSSMINEKNTILMDRGICTEDTFMEIINKIKMHETSEKTVKDRVFYKNLFTDKTFFTGTIQVWLEEENNRTELGTFFDTLKDIFKKTANVNGINPNDWNGMTIFERSE